MITMRTHDTELYRRHADELVRYATVLIGPDDAPDVVVEAFLAATASPGWHEVLNHRAYLFRSVLHRAQSHRRSTDRRSRREARVAARDHQPDHEPSVDARRALTHLTPQQRAVVYLTYWADLTPAHIADILGVSEGSVRKQLGRARDTLRRTLDAD